MIPRPGASIQLFWLTNRKQKRERSAQRSVDNLTERILFETSPLIMQH